MDLDRPTTLADPKMLSTSRYPKLPSTLVDFALPYTSVDHILLSNLVGPVLPSTLVDLTLPSNSKGPALPRPVRYVTFRLLPPPKDKCQDVGIMEESLS